MKNFEELKTKLQRWTGETIEDLVCKITPNLYLGHYKVENEIVYMIFNEEIKILVTRKGKEIETYLDGILYLDMEDHMGGYEEFIEKVNQELDILEEKLKRTEQLKEMCTVTKLL